MGSKQAKIPPEELKILKETTTFTEEQIREWYQGFKVSLQNYSLKQKSKIAYKFT